MLVLTPEEFALLLEMRYCDKLPLGKHNFTNSLQMFDVAVSCKNLLRDLINCSAQDQVVRGVSSQEADSSGNQAEANYLPQSRNGSRCFCSWPVNHTWFHQDTMLSESRSFQEDSGSGPDQPAHAEWTAESKSCKLDFFVQYESVFSEALSDAQAVLKRLEECREIDACQKEALAACLAKAEEQSMFKKLLGQVKELTPRIVTPETLIPGHSDPCSILHMVYQVNGKAHWHFHLPSTQHLHMCVSRVVLGCCEGSSQREAMDSPLRKVDEEKTLKVETSEGCENILPWTPASARQLGGAEHIISSDDAKLVTLPKSQVSQTGSELVTVTAELDLRCSSTWEIWGFFGKAISGTQQGQHDHGQERFMDSHCLGSLPAVSCW
ncbi:hypothetical protein Nmel_015913 [Mimus melanotis]